MPIFSFSQVTSDVGHFIFVASTTKRIKILEWDLSISGGSGDVYVYNEALTVTDSAYTQPVKFDPEDPISVIGFTQSGDLVSLADAAAPIEAYYMSLARMSIQRSYSPRTAPKVTNNQHFALYYPGSLSVKRVNIFWEE